MHQRIHHKPNVLYRYTVNGREYLGDRVRLALVTSTSSPPSPAASPNASAGADVAVYFKPSTQRFRYAPQLLWPCSHRLLTAGLLTLAWKAGMGRPIQSPQHGPGVSTQSPRRRRDCSPLLQEVGEVFAERWPLTPSRARSASKGVLCVAPENAHERSRLGSPQLDSVQRCSTPHRVAHHLQREPPCRNPPRTRFVSGMTAMPRPPPAFTPRRLPKSSVGAVTHPGRLPGGRKGEVLTVKSPSWVSLFLGLNGGPAFQHSEAFSSRSPPSTRPETDRYWNAIVDHDGARKRVRLVQRQMGYQLANHAGRPHQAFTDHDRAAVAPASASPP